MTNQGYPRLGLFDMKHPSLSQLTINIDHLLILSIIIAATQVLHQIDVSGIYEFDEKYILDLHDSDTNKVNITIYEKEKENGWIDDGWKELGHLFIPLDENGIMQINVLDPHSMKKIFPDDAPSIDDTIGADAFWAISHNDIVLNMFTMIYYLIDIRVKKSLDEYREHQDLSDFAKQLVERAMQSAAVSATPDSSSQIADLTKLENQLDKEFEEQQKENINEQ